MHKCGYFVTKELESDGEFDGEAIGRRKAALTEYLEKNLEKLALLKGNGQNRFYHFSQCFFFFHVLKLWQTFARQSIVVRSVQLVNVVTYLSYTAIVNCLCLIVSCEVTAVEAVG